MKTNENSVSSQPLPGIEHVIVLMYENRSFDNVLGGLYPSGKDFDGVPAGWFNPFIQKNGSTIPIQAWQGATREAQMMPNPDPNEDFLDMSEQISGGTMQGFANNYAKAVEKQEGREATLNEVSQIMQYYNDNNMPVTHAFARQYAVSDRYFGSGPVQTWPNRLFAHSGTPGSNGNRAYINNTDYPDYPAIIGQLEWKTVFELLDEKYPGDQKNWKVYYDDEAPISALFKYVNDRWNKIEPGGHVIAYKSDLPEYYDDFFQDVENDRLPMYSFIEPRYQEDAAGRIIPPNSNHPGSASLLSSTPPINVRHGEKMLAEIVSALNSKPELFEKTLLIVTYDEHGGLFDHVEPPAAISPFQPGTVANFNYNQYGPRVPALFINPKIKHNTVLRPSEGIYFDHTSIISTLCAQFGLDGPLTPRDHVAPVFEGLISEDMDSLNFCPDGLLLSATDSKKIPLPVLDLINQPKALPTHQYGSPAYAVYYTAFVHYKGMLKK